MDGVFKKDGRKKLPKERHLHLALSSLFSQEGRKAGSKGRHGREDKSRENKIMAAAEFTSGLGTVN